MSDQTGKVGAIEVADEDVGVPTEEEKQETSQVEEVPLVETVVVETPVVEETTEVEEISTPAQSVSGTEYIGKRLTAYRQNSLDLEDIGELVIEYVLSLAGKDMEVTQKYETILSEIFQKRQAIKQQFPKS